MRGALAASLKGAQVAPDTGEPGSNTPTWCFFISVYHNDNDADCRENKR